VRDIHSRCFSSFAGFSFFSIRDPHSVQLDIRDPRNGHRRLSNSLASLCKVTVFSLAADLTKLHFPFFFPSFPGLLILFAQGLLFAGSFGGFP